MRNKPKRPYANLSAFRRLHFFWKRDQWLTENADKWPCLVCFARGWNYDPATPSCPIEGNKMRDTLRCTVCGGTGCGPRKAVAEAYQAAIARWRQEAHAYDALVQIRKEALRKLTQEEINALQELGV